MNGKKEGEKVFRGLLERLRDDRRLEFCVYAALACFAVLILVLSGGGSCGGKADRSESDGRSETGNELEKRLEDVLSGIRGVGRVSVLLTYESGSEESAYALAQSEGLFVGREAAQLWNSASSPDTSDSSNRSGLRVSGAIVVAEGADDLMVRTELQYAVKTLLGIDIDRIGVYTMRPQE